jgi:ABC-2 type transport system ATP-binding protein/ribosome-dependent ATPase
MTLVAIRGVTKRFGPFTAVDGVDLSVSAGEVVGLLGANGAGKTTLVRLLLGLERPTAGSVAVFGAPPSRRTRRRIGYVPQGLGLYDDLTVRENLAFAAAAFGAHVLVPDDLAAVAGVLVGDLPLGLARRVAFAAARQHGPGLLVLDEPTSGVDPVARADLWDTIRTTAEQGAGVLVTTHHMDEAEECDRLVMMAAGRVVAEGTAGELSQGSTTVVRTDGWTAAFDALEAAGFTVAVVGTSLRLPGADPAEVEAALRRRSLDAQVDQAPTTLDEAFAALVTGAS